MLLAIDVGNTTPSIGLFAGKELKEHLRLSSLRERTPDEWGRRSLRSATMIPILLCEACRSPGSWSVDLLKSLC
jgi:pantothenate kinase type III